MISPMNSSIDMIINPRSVALGETGVSNPLIQASYVLNPATLTGVKGFSLFFDQRSANYDNNWTKDSRLQSISALVQTGIGNFGLNYRKYDYGVWDFWSPSGVILGEFHSFHSTLALSYARLISPSISIGISLMNYDHHWEEVSGDLPDYSSIQSVMGDFGVLYQRPGYIDQLNISDNIFIGASILHVGTEFKSKYGSYDEALFGIPVYLNFGVTYQLSIVLENGYTPFQFAVSSDVKKIVKNLEDDSESLYGGVGMEASFFELLSFRIGGTYLPKRFIFGFEDRMNMRYGFGFDLPLNRMGIDYPVTILVDYANIPLIDLGFIDDMNTSFSLFGFGIKYSGFH